MNPSQRSDSYESVDYTGVLRRRWWLVLALAIAGLVIGLAYAEVAPKSYTATASVNVVATGADTSNQNVSNSRTGGSVNLDTESQLVTSGTVATIAQKMMHSPLPAWQLSKQISVTIPPNSSILTINCSASSATAAATCAQDFARAYLQNRSASAAASIASEQRTLSSKISSLKKSMATLNTQISAQPKNSSTRATDQSNLSNDRTQLSQLTQHFSQLTSESANVNGGSIITNATPPGKPSSPKKSIILPSGLVGGLLIGLIAAFIWDRRDKRLHTAQDVERLLGLPVMLDLPRGATGRQISLASPRSRPGRAFTEFAHTVAASLGEGSHVVLVAGTASGPAASVVAANLATTLARTQSETVLVCADMRDSVATDLFGLSESRGLAEVVAGRATVGEVARGPSGAPGLWVIPPGADPALAEYHLRHDTAKALTAQLRRDARFVVIETQATDEGADTFALAEFADAAVITVETNRTLRAQASACIQRLRRMRTPIMGAAVLPQVDMHATFRAPQPGQSRMGGDGPDTVLPRRAQGELPPLTDTPRGRGQDQPLSRDGHGDPADRVSGR